jgi:uncharacterized DUF497 family protein
LELEWDEPKRQWTLKNRGLDFADVERFDPATVTTTRDDRRDYGEVRFNTMGYLDGTLCTFCWTLRGPCVRIISLRKANDRELKRYEADRQAGRNP